MKNIKISFAVVVVFLMAGFNHLQAAEPFMSDIIRAELEVVNISNKSVVFGGKQYQFSLDASKSSYRSNEDKAGMLKLTDLKPGILYYFEIIANGRDIKNNNYTDVIFISTNKPSE